MAEVPIVSSSIASVGTTLFNMAVNPVSGALYVSNIDALNHVRFAGDSQRANSSVRGHLADHRPADVDPHRQLPRKEVALGPVNSTFPPHTPSVPTALTHGDEFTLKSCVLS